MALFSRIFEYLDLPVDIADPADPVRLDPDVVRGEVRFERVGFSYPEGARPALTDVDLTVPAGASAGPRRRDRLRQEHARLAGGAAARPDHRPGLDRRRRRPGHARWPTSPRVVGVVSQETYLLHATIRENLRYAKPDATDAEIGGRGRGGRRSTT